MERLTEEDVNRLVSYRRDLHAHPELALEEEWTAAFIMERLREIGVEAYDRVGGYGVVGVIHGQAPGPSIALRADMDALAIDEKSGLAYASKYPGKMHACGHDGHISILLGAATLLARSRAFQGTVYLVFQPAEERCLGAWQMMNDRLLDRFPFGQIFGLHNWPGMPAGQVLLHDGPVMAGSAEFELTFSANGAHAAMPHLSGDPLLAGGHFIVGIQQAVGRAVNPLEAAVVTVGSFQGGYANNIIPVAAVLKGTCRAFTTETLELLRERVEKIAASAAAIASCTHKVQFDEPTCPAVVNTPFERDIMRGAIQTAGLTAFQGDSSPTMGGDDFGFFLKYRPGAYAWIGNGPAASDSRLHQPAYDFNDATIEPGAMLMAHTAVAALDLQSLSAVL